MSGERFGHSNGDSGWRWDKGGVGMGGKEACPATEIKEGLGKGKEYEVRIEHRIIHYKFCNSAFCILYSAFLHSVFCILYTAFCILHSVQLLYSFFVTIKTSYFSVKFLFSFRILNFSSIISIPTLMWRRMWWTPTKGFPSQTASLQSSGE